MEKKYGIVMLTKVLMLVVELANVADLMGRTKGAAKYMHLMKLIDEIQEIGDVKFDQVKLELGELDAEERAAILLALKTKLDLTDDKLEVVIEDGLALAAEQAALVDRGIAFAKALKA